MLENHEVIRDIPYREERTNGLAMNQQVIVAKFPGMKKHMQISWGKYCTVFLEKKNRQ